MPEEIKIEAPQIEIKEMFTPDEVKQRQDDLTSLWTDRRSKLSPEDLKKEDEQLLTEKQKKADEDKQREEAEKANAIPEAYADFKLPEGMKMDAELLKQALPKFKELGLSQAKAQEVIDLYTGVVYPSIVKTQTDNWLATREGWRETIKADKEIGGDKFDASVKDAQRVLNTIGTDELKKAMNEYGLGDHPEFVRVFARMAKNLKEDTIDINKQGGAFKPATTIDEMAKSIYPDKQ